MTNFNDGLLNFIYVFVCHFQGRATIFQVTSGNRSGCFGPLLSLSCCMLVILGVSETASATMGVLFFIWALSWILGYHWNNFVINERLFHEAGMKRVHWMIQQIQIQLGSKMKKFSGSDSVCVVVSDETSLAWRRPKRRLGMTGRAKA